MDGCAYHYCTVVLYVASTISNTFAQSCGLFFVASCFLLSRTYVLSLFTMLSLFFLKIKPSTVVDKIVEVAVEILVPPKANNNEKGYHNWYVFGCWGHALILLAD